MERGVWMGVKERSRKEGGKEGVRGVKREGGEERMRGLDKEGKSVDRYGGREEGREEGEKGEKKSKTYYIIFLTLRFC